MSVNDHMLSDFRVEHGEKLNELLTDSVILLIDQGLVALEEFGHDGMRLRSCQRGQQAARFAAARRSSS